MEQRTDARLEKRLIGGTCLGRGAMRANGVLYSEICSPISITRSAGTW